MFDIFKSNYEISNVERRKVKLYFNMVKIRNISQYVTIQISGVYYVSSLTKCCNSFCIRAV